MWFAAAASILFAAWAAGESALRGLRWTGAPGIGRAALAAALGLCLCGLGIWALGMAQLLRPGVVQAATAGLCALGGWMAARGGMPRPPRLRGAEWPLAAMFAAAAVLLLAVAANPELEIDELTYHQTVQRAYLNAGGYFFTPFEPHAAIHQLNNTTAAWSFALLPSSTITPKLLEASRVVLAALLAAAFGSWLFGRLAGLGAGALALLCTDFLRYGTTSQVDAGMAMQFTAAAWLLARWLGGDGGVRDLSLGAFLAGCVYGAKQTGAFLAGPLLASALLVRILSNGLSRREAAIALAAAVVAALPWWIRNAALFGSPLHPFFLSIIPPHEDARIAHAFLGRYYPEMEMSLARLLPDLQKSYTIFANLRLSNVLGFAALWAMAALLFLTERGQRGSPLARRDPRRLFLYIAYAPILYALLHTSFWRFMLPVYPVALMLFVGEADRRLASFEGKRWMRPYFVGLLALLFLRDAVPFAMHGNFGAKALSRPPHGPIVSQAGVQCYYDAFPDPAEVVEWLNAEVHPSEGALLFSVVVPNAPLLSIEFLPNVPCIAMDGVTTMDFLGMEAGEMAAAFDRLGIRWLATREQFPDGEPARFREGWLAIEREWPDRRGAGAIRLYRFEAASD